MAVKMAAKHVLLTGKPGVGKTTAVKQACEVLKQKNVKFQGFYTEELRRGDLRIGFDIVTTDGKRSTLSRISEESMGVRGPRLGKYIVDVPSFEKLALPALTVEGPVVLIVDEIGKMELFSQSFQEAVKSALRKPEIKLLATVPISKVHSLQFVEEIKSRRDVTIITVTRENQAEVVRQIIEHLSV